MAKRLSLREKLADLLKKNSYQRIRNLLDEEEGKRHPPLSDGQKEELKKFAALHREAEQLCRDFGRLSDMTFAYVSTEDVESGISEAHDNAVHLSRFTEAPQPGRPIDVDPQDISECWRGIRGQTAFALGQIKSVRRQLATAEKDLDVIEGRLKKLAEQAKGRR